MPWDTVPSYASRMLQQFQADKLPRRMPITEVIALGERFDVYTFPDVEEMTLREVADHFSKIIITRWERA